MKVIITLALILSILHFSGLPKYLADFSLSFQNICQDMTPNLSKEHATLASLVCGKKVSDPKNLLALQTTGLIHIFVVSAGHLVVISEILVALGWSRILVTFTLLGFTLMTGLQAPCVRSLLSLLVGSFLSHQGLFLSGPQIVFATGTLTLALFPDWCQSLSLQLSWAAALALSISSTFQNKNHSAVKRLISTSFWVFVILLPFLQSLGGLHPLSIIWNVTLGSLTAFFLFPLSLLAFVNPFFLQILEFMMKPFWALLQLNHDFQFETTKEPPSSLNGWVWIFGLHLLLHGSALFYQRNYKT